MALELHTLCSTLVALLNRTVRDQLERASLSVVLNIAEAGGRSSRRDKARFYAIARGSATEVAALLDVLTARRLVSPASVKTARRLAIRVVQMLSRIVIVDADAHPGSVKHLEDAGVLGQPRQVNRAGARANRADALRGKEKVPGMDLDESPPAFLRKPGERASVRPLEPCDNRGCGASMGNQARDVSEGGWVVIVPKEKP